MVKSFLGNCLIDPAICRLLNNGRAKTVNKLRILLKICLSLFLYNLISVLKYLIPRS
jgi:hypothetical protein